MRILAGMTLGRKLAVVAFIVLLAFGVFFALFVQQQRIGESVVSDGERFQGIAQRIGAVKSGLNASLALERAFLLKPDGAAVGRHARLADAIEADLEALNVLLPERGTLVLEARQLAREHRAGFASLVDRQVVLGYDENSGLHGAMRRSVHAVESRLEAGGQLELSQSMLLMRRHEKDYIQRGEADKYLGKMAAERVRFHRLLARSAMGTERSIVLALMDDYQRRFEQFVLADQVRLAELRLQQARAEAIEPLLDRLDGLRAELNASTQERTRQVQAQNRQITLVILLASLFLVSVALTLVARSLAGPISEAMAAVRRIAKGDYTQPVASPHANELGELLRALDRVQGDLREMTARTEAQRWQQEGRAQLLEVMRGDQDIEELAKHLIDALCRLLGARVGALYVMDESGSRLVLAASHAFTRRPGRAIGFAVGEGLVGEAARDGTPMFLADVPADYLPVESGSGDHGPSQLALIPFLHNGQTKGVIELGLFTPLDDSALALLEQLRENIAIAFSASQSRLAQRRLLDEVRSSNEELQAQQVQIQRANAELEENARKLEHSQQELEMRNKQLQATQAALNERAEQLSLSSKYKSEFLANMSHELRTPLNSILLLSKMLSKAPGGLSEQQRRQAATIHAAGSDLLQLINEVLDLSKIESGQLRLDVRPAGLEEVLDQMEQQFRPMAEDRRLAFALERGAGLPERIDTDPDRLAQVLKNFLSNAFKFTEQGGVTLRVEAQVKPLIAHLLPDGAHRDAVIASPGDFLAFQVIDTGIGIPESERLRVFEAFQQVDGSTRRAYGGTGLGLSIATRIAEALGGAIAMQSTPGKGSCFSLLLPRSGAALVASVTRAKAAPREAIAPAAPAAGSDREGPLLLVAEDDAQFARILRELGEARGFRVVQVDNGVDAVREAKALRPDAIILDIILPGIDGWDVLRELKQDPATRGAPVHILSALDDDGFGRQLGAVQHLVKPVSEEMLDQVFDHLEEFLRRRLRRLLVVEDNPAEREALTALLSERDLEVVAVATGQEALDAVRSTEFDCAIVDLGLPDIDGYEVLQRIHADPGIAHFPAIVYTARDLTERDEKELARYASRIVLKQGKPSQRLLEEVSRFLHRTLAPAPAATAGVAPDALAAAAPLRIAVNGKQLLLVDDDVRNAFALGACLESAGYTVHGATNGREALDVLDSYPGVDLVLMDIMMPVMDGYEAIAHIRADGAHGALPIIAITAKALPGDRQKCLEAGATDYVTKPVDPERLLALIRAHLSMAPEAVR